MSKQDDTGHDNTGYGNTGYYNAGNYNAGNSNSGSYNAGCFNAGDYNAGSHNAGSHNSGCYNSGHYNSGHYNSGFAPISHFCSFSIVNRPVYLFNKLAPPNTSPKLPKIIHIGLNVKGDSRVVPYKEAWAVAWDKASEEDKNNIFALPNFDQDVFQDITGIDLRSPKAAQEDAPEIVIGGKKYKLVEVD